MYRKVRRLVLRKFGGYRNLALCVVLAILFVLVYHYKSAVVPIGRRLVWDGNVNPKNISGAPCGVRCAPGQVAFTMTTGTGMDMGPSLCFNGKMIFSPELQNVGRGINAAFIDPATFEVRDQQTFDTYIDAYPFLRYVRDKVPIETLVMAASFDEVSEGLKEDGRNLFTAMGSTLISKIQFRDAFLLVGQMGLKTGHAIDFYTPREGRAFAGTIDKQGCFSLPLGPIGDLGGFLPSLQPAGVMQPGRDLKNCGMESECVDGTFSVMVDTGKSDKAVPRICVAGKIVVDKQLNDAGRGFNIVVVDHLSYTVKTLARFDTYLKDSLNLEFFVDKMEAGNFLIAVVNDDGSRKLSLHARELFNQLGSSMVQNLKFRDVWYFVGQHGIQGFTKHEQIAYAGFDGEWPKVLQKAFCVSQKLEGLKVAPDPGAHRNEGRRAFCKKYDGYAEFCDSASVDEAIIPVNAVEKSLLKNSIYDIPIIIIPGLDHNALVRTLETTLMQPGVRPSHVTVMWDEKSLEHAELAELFSYNNHSLSSSLTYTDQVKKALPAAWKLNPDAKYLIVLEEELVLAPDFLSFMGHCLAILDMDATLLGASAWNYNGYDTTSGDRTLAYRVEEFPGLAFLLKRSVYDIYMKNRLPICCSERVWDGWVLTGEVVGEILVPDVSRVYRQQYQTSHPDENYITELFNKPRMTNLEGGMHLKALRELSSDRYDDLLHQKLSSAAALPKDLLIKCITVKGYQLYVPPKIRSSFAVYFEQSGPEDFSLWRQLSSCFGLYSYEGHTPRNLHKGVLRFYFARREAFLIGSASSVFYKHKPTDYKALNIADVGHR